MRLMASLVALFALGGQAYRPPYPRFGTKALIDNARAQVWDVSWPKTTTPPGIHPSVRHDRSLLLAGDRRITQPDGTTCNVTTEAGRIQWQLKGITHMEEGISDDPLRAVMIQLKVDGPSGKVELCVPTSRSARRPAPPSSS
jgi:hypothetical protein